MVCLIQTRICFIIFAVRACFWLIFSLVSTGIPSTFSANLSSCTAPSVYCYLELFHPSAEFFVSPCWSPWDSWVYFCNCWDPSGWQHNPLTSTSATPPSLMSFTTLLRVHSATLPHHLHHYIMLNRSGASTGFISIPVPIYQWHTSSNIKKKVLNILRPENISPSRFLQQ